MFITPLNLLPFSVYICNDSMILLIALYKGVLNQNVCVFEIFSFFLNIFFLNDKAFLNQLFNLCQIMLASRIYALLDTFLVLEAFSLVSQYLIASVNGIKFQKIHHTCRYTCHDQCKSLGKELFTNKQTRGGLTSCQW